jgi:predicted small secreted protein
MNKIIRGQKSRLVIVVLGLSIIFMNGCITVQSAGEDRRACAKATKTKKCPECLRVYDDGLLANCPYDDAQLVGQ